MHKYERFIKLLRLKYFFHIFYGFGDVQIIEYLDLALTISTSKYVSGHKIYTENIYLLFWVSDHVSTIILTNVLSSFLVKKDINSVNGATYASFTKNYYNSHFDK